MNVIKGRKCFSKVLYDTGKTRGKCIHKEKGGKSSLVYALYEILHPYVHWGLEPGTSSTHVSLWVMVVEKEFYSITLCLYTTLTMSSSGH